MQQSYFSGVVKQKIEVKDATTIVWKQTKTNLIKINITGMSTHLRVKISQTRAK